MKDRAAKFSDNAEILPIPTRDSQTERLMEDALSALINLGYSAKVAKTAIEQAKNHVKDETLEALIKESLKIMA